MFNHEPQAMHITTPCAYYTNKTLRNHADDAVENFKFMYDLPLARNRRVIIEVVFCKKLLVVLRYFVKRKLKRILLNHS